MNLKTRHTCTVGLTGGILCGKSTALAAWQQAGAWVVSCDDLVREISSRPAVQKQLIARLGSAEPARLAKQIFASAAARKKLEALLHPLVLKALAKRLRGVRQPVRVVEVPLLFEAKWEQYFDMTVALLAPAGVLPARARRRGMNVTDFLKRQHAQLPAAEKAARADISVVNDGTVNNLKQTISVLHRALMQIYTVE